MQARTGGKLPKSQLDNVYTGAGYRTYSSLAAEAGDRGPMVSIQRIPPKKERGEKQKDLGMVGR